MIYINYQNKMLMNDFQISQELSQSEQDEYNLRQNSKVLMRCKTKKNQSSRNNYRMVNIDYFKKSGLNMGQWLREQKILYLQYLENYPVEMHGDETYRRSKKIFANMALFVKTRDGTQCKTHHQKMLFCHQNVEGIIYYLKRKLFPLPDEVKKKKYYLPKKSCIKKVRGARSNDNKIKRRYNKKEKHSLSEIKVEHDDNQNRYLLKQEQGQNDYAINYFGNQTEKKLGAAEDRKTTENRSFYQIYEVEKGFRVEIDATRIVDYYI